MKWKLLTCPTLCVLMDCILYSPWNSPGQNTGVCSLSLLWGIFQTQGSNPGLLHCRQILYQLSHQGSPRILEWIACPFSSGSSRTKDWTGVSCIADKFFTNWAIREAQKHRAENTQRENCVYFVGNCSCLVLLEFEFGGIDGEFRAYKSLDGRRSLLLFKK